MKKDQSKIFVFFTYFFAVMIVASMFGVIYFLGYLQSPTNWHNGYKKGYNDAVTDIILFQETHKLEKEEQELLEELRSELEDIEKLEIKPKKPPVDFKNIVNI